MLSDGKRAFQLLRGCWKTLLLFEILFRIFTNYILFPIEKWLFNFCLQLTNIYYVSVENILRFLSNPLMILCCIILFLLFSLTAMTEISCLITCMHSSQKEDTLGIFQLFAEGLRNAVRLLRIRNLPLLILTAFMVPVSQLPTSASMLQLINIPWSSLAGYLVQYPYVFILAAYIGISLIYLAFCMGVYHCYVLEDVPAHKAFSHASAITRGHRIYHLAELLLYTFAVSGIMIAVVTLLSVGVQYCVDLITDDLNLQYRILLPFNLVFNFIKSVSPAVSYYAILSIIYRTSMEGAGEIVPTQAIPTRKNAVKFNAVIFYIVAAVIILCVVPYDTVLRPALARYNAINYIPSQSTLVIAHRGYAVDTDENTLSAFQAAIDLGVDYIELDVQQTADGVVIINHDNSFQRVYNESSYVWELTYDEVRSLSSLNSGECPPTLYEVLTLCDPSANLLIELKNNGHNPDLVQSVYDILIECDCLNRCIIQSSSYKYLREFKALSPDTRCGYILSFSLGNYTSLDYADFFSVDYDFVNESIVNSIHSAGKSLYVWTINSETVMEEMLSLGVDGIITDDVPLAKHTMLSMSTTTLEEIISDPIQDALEEQINSTDDSQTDDE